MMRILLLLFFSASCWAINISHFPKSVQKEIREAFPNIGKKKFRGYEIDQIIKVLMKTGNYENVSIMEFKGEYKIETVRIRKVKNITFIGNEFVGDSQLLSIGELQVGDPFDPRLLVESGRKIKEYYADLGYLRAKVEMSVSNSTESTLDINTTISEGPLSSFKRVTFETENKKLKKSLIELTKPYIDQALTKGRLNGINTEIENFFAKNLYYTTTITDRSLKFNENKSEAYINFKISDPFKYSIIFLGNANYSEIRSDIDIDSVAASPSNMIPELKSRVKSRYLKRGYARINVKTDLRENLKKYSRTLRVLIQEGPRVVIDRIEVSGRYLRPQEYYSKFILENSSELVREGFYNKSDINDGYRSLEAHLQNQGYLQAKIQSSSLHYNKTKDSVSLRVNLIEGPLTRVQSIEFSGVKLIPQQKLYELLNLNPGSALHLNELEEGINKIRQYYLDSGHLEMRYLKDKKEFIQYNSDNTLARLNIDVYEGPQIIVQSIIIEGTKQTRDYVVLMELEFEPGDILTPELIKESRFRLQQTGLFASIQIDTLEKNSSLSRRTLLVNVTERNPGLFSIGGGLDNDFGGTYRFNSGVTYRNLRKRAHVASARIELSRPWHENDNFFDHRLLFGYKYPYLIGTRMSGHINIERKQNRQTVDRNVYNESSQATLSLQQDLTSDIKLVFEVFSIDHILSVRIDNRERIDGSDSNIRSIGPYIEIDKRDSPTNTKKGWFSSMTLEYGDPMFGPEAPHFLRTKNVFHHYYNVYGNWTWKNSFTFSYLKHLNTSNDPNDENYVPYSRRGLFLGGQSTIRGFLPSERFPTNGSLGVYKIEDFRLETDARSYLVSSELRFPLPWEAWGGAFFYDGGIVQVGDLGSKLQWCKGSSGSRTCERPWRHSVGLAGRYIAQGIGAVSAGVGFKLDRQDWLIQKVDDEGKLSKSYSPESEYAFFISFSTL